MKNLIFKLKGIFMKKSHNTNIPATAKSSAETPRGKIRAVDKATFNFIVKYYMPKLKAIARNRLDSGMDADDAVQETLILAYRNLEAFRGNALLSSWLCSILINQVNNHYRNRKRWNLLLEDYKSTCISKNYATDRAAEYESADLCSAIYKKISELPVAPRMALLLWLRGLKYSEIAARNNCSIGTVKSQLARARKHLKKLLKTDKVLAGLLEKL